LGDRTKEIRKAKPLRGKLVDIRSSGVQTSIRAAKARPTDIVGKDDHKVRLVRTQDSAEKNSYEK